MGHLNLPERSRSTLLNLLSSAIWETLLFSLDPCPHRGGRALLYLLMEHRRPVPHRLHQGPPPFCARGREGRHHVVFWFLLNRLGGADEPRRRLLVEADGAIRIRPVGFCVRYVAKLCRPGRGRQERVCTKMIGEEAAVHGLRGGQLVAATAQRIPGEVELAH